MKIDVNFSGELKLTNDEGEVVYHATVEDYVMQTDPAKLMESIGDVALQIGTQFAAITSKLEAIDA